MESDTLDVKNLKGIAFVIAAWCRYLMAVGDDGQPFQPSDDPLMPMLAPRFQDVQLGAPCDVHALLQPVLSDARIMGVVLYEAGLGELAEANFRELIAGPGAIRAALHRLVENA